MAKEEITINEEHMRKVAKELGFEIEFNSDNPGVLDTTTGELRTFESYLGVFLDGVDDDDANG